MKSHGTAAAVDLGEKDSFLSMMVAQPESGLQWAGLAQLRLGHISADAAPPQNTSSVIKQSAARKKSVNRVFTWPLSVDTALALVCAGPGDERTEEQVIALKQCPVPRPRRLLPAPRCWLTRAVFTPGLAQGHLG